MREEETYLVNKKNICQQILQYNTIVDQFLLLDNIHDDKYCESMP